MIEPDIAAAFGVHENKGVYALLLGSGVSRAAEIPTGWEIVSDLVQRVGGLKGVENQSDWPRWYRETFGRDPDYSELINALGTTPNERRAIVHRYIEATPADIEAGKRVPTDAHRAIARLVRDGFVRVIITTNFDRLMENALREEGVEPTIIKSDADLEGAQPIQHSRCFLVKLHGDYLDTRIRNTSEELTKYSPRMHRLLARILDEYGLIICGWSSDWDHALRDAISRSPSRRYMTFWATRTPLKGVAEDLLGHRAGLQVLIRDADSFFTALSQRVATLEDSGRPNPRTVDLLAAETRRILTRPNPIIPLNDLVAVEVSSLLERTSQPDLSPQGGNTLPEFRRRANAFEAASLRLVVLAMTIGRWGGPDTSKIVADTIRSICRDQDVQGITTWLWMKTYPAVLIASAYLVGLMMTQRRKEVREFLELKLNKKYRDPMTFQNVVSVDNWSGNETERWNWLFAQGDKPGNRRTPFSDHVLSVLSPAINLVAFPNTDVEALFGEVEILSSISYLASEVDPSDLKRQMDSRSDAYVSAPIGRMGWNTQVREEIIRWWKEPAVAADLISAGYATNQTHLEMQLENLGRLWARFGRW